MAVSYAPIPVLRGPAIEPRVSVRIVIGGRQPRSLRDDPLMGAAYTARSLWIRDRDERRVAWSPMSRCETS
jgi:hypothetical protein